MLRQFLQSRRDSRARVDRDASDLIRMAVGLAYPEARDRARHCWERQDSAGHRHWSRVAVEIARRTGHRIGEKVADRYERARKEERRGPLGSADAIADIAAGIADLANGREGVTAQQVCALVWQAREARRTSEVDDAAHHLCTLIDALARDPAGNLAQLAAGAYPRNAETAGLALQRFRAALSA